MTNLPCHPCPHGSACCTWGTPLTEDEAFALDAEFGSDAVSWDAEEGEFRTTTPGGTCFFQTDNACLLHDHPAYPSVCRGFPFRPDGSEVDICPELLTGRRPELDALFDPATKRLRT